MDIIQHRAVTCIFNTLCCPYMSYGIYAYESLNNLQRHNTCVYRAHIVIKYN